MSTFPVRKDYLYLTGRNQEVSIIHLRTLCFIAVVTGLSSNTEANHADVKGPGFGVWPACLWPNSVSDYLRKCTHSLHYHVKKPLFCILYCTGFQKQSQEALYKSQLQNPVFCELFM